MADIKAIIDSACKEFTVEENLENITHTLSDLGFKYKINSSGIKVITNDAQVSCPKWISTKKNLKST